MMHQNQRRCTALSGVGAFMLLAAIAQATPTGLNNIITADTAPDRTVVFQGFSFFGDDRRPQHFAGFKMGLRPWNQRFEWGLDGSLGPDEEGPIVLQLKYAVQPWEKLPTLALGAANVAFTESDREDVGQAFKYLVFTQDFDWFRAHAGYGLRQNNNAGFFGLDKSIRLFDRELVLRTDAIQINDQDQWLVSGGFIYFPLEFLAVESWISQPLEDGKPIFTIKLNLIWKF